MSRRERSASPLYRIVQNHLESYILSPREPSDRRLLPHSPAVGTERQMLNRLKPRWEGALVPDHIGRRDYQASGGLGPMREQRGGKQGGKGLSRLACAGCPFLEVDVMEEESENRLYISHLV